MAKSSSSSSKPTSSSRPTKYAKSALACKYTPVQIKRIIAASKKEYADLARKYNMPIRTAYFFRNQKLLAQTSSAEKKKRVNRLFMEGIRFCLQRKRSYKNIRDERPTKSVTYEEIRDFMSTNSKTYSVEKVWIPKERTLRGMISADKKRRNPTGHKRTVERLKNTQITADQCRGLQWASRYN